MVIKTLHTFNRLLAITKLLINAGLFLCQTKEEISAAICQNHSAIVSPKYRLTRETFPVGYPALHCCNKKAFLNQLKGSVE